MDNKYIASALVILGMQFQPNLAYAEEGCRVPDCCIVAMEPLDPCCVNGGYPLPGAIQPDCSWNFYAQGDFLYWSTLYPLFGNAAKKLDLVTFAPEFSVFGPEAENLFISKHYRPGFRVAIGLNVADVVLDATYIRYHARFSSQFRATEPNQVIQFVFYPVPIMNPNALGFNTVNFSQFNPTYHFNIDTLFLTVKKPVYTGKAFIMSLNYALMMQWDEQKNRIDAITTGPLLPAVNGFVSTIHKSFYVGPDLGVTARALLPWGFEGIAKIDLSGGMAYMYKGSSTASFPGALPPSTLRTRGNVVHLQAYHNGEIGLAWSSYLWCDHYHLSLEATYNFLYQHVFSFGTFENMTITSYSIHGFAFGGRVDF